MAASPIVDTQMVAELKSAIKECSDRGLSVASKWASELHLSIPNNKRRLFNSSPSSIPAFSTSTPLRVRSPPPSAPFRGSSPVPTQQDPLQMISSRHPHATMLVEQLPDVVAIENGLEAQEEDALVTARACIDAREFKRASHLLRDCKSSKARFLSTYSQFIVSPINLLRYTHITTALQGVREKGSTRLAQA
ncbi:hypothetical protein DXG01_003864 [Tephrocybe rancida]|nr:hypothetical protein DXG01_003864 [Tephrocybe rancida]